MRFSDGGIPVLVDTCEKGIGQIRNLHTCISVPGQILIYSTKSTTAITMRLILPGIFPR